MRCRHRKMWIIVGGHAAWCYECGAWRQMRPVDGTNEVVPISMWVRPTGPGGKNPYDPKAWSPVGATRAKRV